MVSRENQDGDASTSPLQKPSSPGESPKGRSPKSQATALEDETKRILGSRSGTIERVIGYQPTLQEFTSTSFSDYVRETLLGVIFDEDDNSTNDEIQAAQPNPPLDTTNAGVSSFSQKSSGSCAGDAAGTSTYVYSKNGPKKLRDENCEKGKSPHGKNAAASNVSPPGDARRKQTPFSMITRSQRRKSDSAKLQTDTSGVASSPTGVAAATTRKRDGPRSMCGHKFSDGVAKITPPCGWWDMSGVGNDLTMRGPAWQAGSRLGDMVISDPIKQCASGIGGVYEYTMLELPPITISEFGKKADKFRKSQVGSEYDEDTSDEFLDGLARKFWRRLGPTMEASMYGADMEGTLFQGANASGWNVDQLESCLQLLKADADDGPTNDGNLSLPGVTTAYLYAGMWASVFAVHSEDMNLLSINYLHAGAPKYWYSINPEDSPRFESLAASHFGDAASACHEFLRHKRYLLSPTLLKKAGIRYKTLIQRAGDIVITFPGAYHFGFNTGFNMAESTNFAVPEWIHYGKMAHVCMCHPHSVRIDMKRFQTLFDAYEDDMEKADKTGSPRMTYTEWAKHEKMKRNDLKKQEEQTVQIKDDDDDDDDIALIDPVLPKISYNKGMVIEVMRATARKTGSPDLPKKSAKSSKKKEIEDWRLALKVKAATFTPQTPVICYVPVDGLTNDEKETDKFFCGTITQVVEGHARIHFAGTSKKEDIWLPTNSPRMFLDGGSEDPPQDKKKERKSGKRPVESGRSQKKKLRTP